MLEVCDTFIEPAIYKKYDKSLEAHLQYRLIVTPDPYNRTENHDVFSLLVIKIQKGYRSESKFIYDICRTRDKAFKILTLMAENQVTPLCAADVIEDFV